jgi:hypothetical protein
MAAGDPTGPDLASGTIDGNTLPEYPTPHQNVKITFGAGTALTAGVVYAIVVRATGSGLANYAYWDIDAGLSDDYAGGKGFTSTESGSSWSNLGNQDFYFKAYTGAGFNVLRDNHTFADTGTPGGEFTDTIWKAQTFTATSSYTITAVNLELSRKAGSSPGTITVSIRATEGGAPGKAQNPTPSDNQGNIDIAGVDRITKLQWAAPEGETPDYLVYFRAGGGSWVLYDTITDDSTEYELSDDILNALRYYSIYEWRVDTRENGVTTTGDTWTFISEVSMSFTDYSRRSDYDADKVWQPGTGWVDPNTFEFAGGGSYKERVVVVGHNVIYFGDI